jgi:hypothetical protein
VVSAPPCPPVTGCRPGLPSVAHPNAPRLRGRPDTGRTATRRHHRRRTHPAGPPSCTPTPGSTLPAQTRPRWTACLMASPDPWTGSTQGPPDSDQPAVPDGTGSRLPPGVRWRPDSHHLPVQDRGLLLCHQQATYRPALQRWLEPEHVGRDPTGLSRWCGDPRWVPRRQPRLCIWSRHPGHLTGHQPVRHSCVTPYIRTMSRSHHKPAASNEYTSHGTSHDSTCSHATEQVEQCKEIEEWQVNGPFRQAPGLRRTPHATSSETCESKHVNENRRSAAHRVQIGPEFDVRCVRYGHYVPPLDARSATARTHRRPKPVTV